MVNRVRLDFPNAAGERLAASLELPLGKAPRAYALFAHCFTCGKNIRAASRVARSLAEKGYGVLRFDFTGLGGSEGDFANSNFSSNVEDLVAAADFLRENYQAPQLLVGHSLGGTAVLAAAPQIPEVQALATIGAPSNPEHLLKHLGSVARQNSDPAGVEVQIAGRSFTIKPQFVEDLKNTPVSDRLRKLERPLLILHAPFDEVVSVDEATSIFQAAKHPKSFITLDGADHMLSDSADAHYVADTIATWAQRYLTVPEAADVQPSRGEVFIGEEDHKFLRSVISDDHRWEADEPKAMGGHNLGPDPYEHLLAALGTCTSMTIRMYANRKKWPLDNVDMWLTHTREHVQDCEDCETSDSRVDIIRRRIQLEGDLSDKQRARLLEIADRCPVHRTLRGDIQIETQATDRN